MKQSDISSQVVRKLALIGQKLDSIVSAYQELEQLYELVEGMREVLEIMLQPEVCEACGRQHEKFKLTRVPRVLVDMCLEQARQVNLAYPHFRSEVGTRSGKLTNLCILLEQLNLKIGGPENETE